MSCNKLNVQLAPDTGTTSISHNTAPDTYDPLPLFTIFIVSPFSASFSRLLFSIIPLQSSFLFTCRRSSPDSKLASEASRMMFSTLVLALLCTICSADSAEIRQTFCTFSAMGFYSSTSSASSSRGTFWLAEPKCSSLSPSSVHE